MKDCHLHITTCASAESLYGNQSNRRVAVHKPHITSLQGVSVKITTGYPISYRPYECLVMNAKRSLRVSARWLVMPNPGCRPDTTPVYRTDSRSRFLVQSLQTKLPKLAKDASSYTWYLNFNKDPKSAKKSISFSLGLSPNKVRTSTQIGKRQTASQSRKRAGNQCL